MTAEQSLYLRIPCLHEHAFDGRSHRDISRDGIMAEQKNRKKKGEADMAFHLIDMEKWERREHYHYYRDLLKVRYNLNVNVDITELLAQVKEQKLKFYPVFIYIIMRAVNQNREMRMQTDSEGRLGYWDECHPSYTIFHPDDKTFSDIWTKYSPDFTTFYRAAVRDMEEYRDVKGVKAKPGRPDNFCAVSCVPWLSFTGYASDTYSDSPMLFPVVLFGRYFEENGRILLPLGIAVNHAAADGYHSCRLLNDIKEIAGTIRLPQNVKGEQ